MQQRTHPFTILVNLWRVFYLAVLPLIRGFVTALGGNFAEWLRGAWFDIAVFLLMLTVATLQWAVQRYQLEDKGIRVSIGLVFRRQTFIRWDRISSISLTAPFSLRPIRVSAFRADTLGGSIKNADLHLYLNSEKAGQVLAACREYDKPSLHTRRYRPTLGSIMALGMLGSHSFAGVLFLSTLVSQSGRLLGKEFADRVVGTFENLTRSLAVGIPPAAAALGYIALAGWLVAFARTLLRYSDFHIQRNDRNLSIRAGRFTKRNYLVDYSHIHLIDIQQTAGFKLLKRYSLYISAAGYGKHKSDITCVLPPEKEDSFNGYRELFFRDFAPCARQLAPRRRGALRFLSAPLCLCLGIPIVMATLLYLNPAWREFVLFVGAMSMLPSLLFLSVRTLDYRTSGIGRNGSFYTLRYSSGFQLHTTVLHASQIVGVELRQGLLQRLAGSCDLFVFTPAERRAGHRCRNLNLAESKAYFSTIG